MFIWKVTTKVSLFQRTIGLKSWNENYKIPLRDWIRNKINVSTHTHKLIMDISTMDISE